MNYILNGTADGNTGNVYNYVKDGVETGASAFNDVADGISKLRNSKANLNNSKNAANRPSDYIYFRGNNSNNNSSDNYFPYIAVGVGLVAVLLLVNKSK